MIKRQMSSCFEPFIYKSTVSLLLLILPKRRQCLLDMSSLLLYCNPSSEGDIPAATEFVPLIM